MDKLICKKPLPYNLTIQNITYQKVNESEYQYKVCGN